MQVASAAQWRWGDAQKILKYWSVKTTERLTGLRAGLAVRKSDSKG
jgi:hypothetical protein